MLEKINDSKKNSLNNNLSNKNSNLKNFNKIYIDIINNIKHKANYFYDKNNKTKEIYNFKTIVEKIIPPKGTYNKNIIIKNKSFSNINIIKFYLNSFKNLNNILISHIKQNGIRSIFVNENSKMKIKNQNKLDLIKPINIKRLNNKNFKTILENDNNNNNNNNNFIKIINTDKNKTQNITAINNILNLDSTEKIKILDQKINNETNKNKSSILLFINKLKQKENKEKNIILKNNIIKYIKTKSNFNSKTAKILTTNNNYNFNKYNQINNLIRNNIYEFLHKSFISMFSIISKPVYITTPNIIIIQLFFLIFKKELIKKNYNKSILILENNNKLITICNILSRFFRKPIKLELIRLYYPYHNSNILVNLLGFFVNKIRLRKIINKFIRKTVKNKSLNNLSKNVLFTDIAGIKIKVAGRLLTQRVVPRKTIKIINRGALSRNKTMFIETARFTNKNKRGAFSLTISIGHKNI